MKKKKENTIDFSPRIYNYSNLKESDKLVVDDLIESANCVLCAIDKIKFNEKIINYISEKNMDINDYIFPIELLYYEIIDDCLALIYGCISSYKEEIKEIDTNDHLYGCDAMELICDGNQEDLID